MLRSSARPSVYVFWLAILRGAGSALRGMPQPQLCARARSVAAGGGRPRGRRAQPWRPSRVPKSAAQPAVPAHSGAHTSLDVSLPWQPRSHLQTPVTAGRHGELYVLRPFTGEALLDSHRRAHKAQPTAALAHQTVPTSLSRRAAQGGSHAPPHSLIRPSLFRRAPRPQSPLRSCRASRRSPTTFATCL